MIGNTGVCRRRSIIGIRLQRLGSRGYHRRGLSLLMGMYLQWYVPTNDIDQSQEGLEEYFPNVQWDMKRSVVGE